ncbi:hypothetical protein SAMN02799630_01747 [Paenibacillus sp. UNCCL117]|nr:hypothetical protein SAMN04488602_104234 [Paenibacillus sp. cl123]SFW29390.1 hypothetical protein SAMN02799630_01747 [Paenibacillus sp. UNCCL117]
MEVKNNQTQYQPYKGFPLLVLLFVVVLFSPLFYFVINLMLGNEAMFIAPLQ